MVSVWWWWMITLFQTWYLRHSMPLMASPFLLWHLASLCSQMPRLMPVCKLWYPCLWMKWGSVDILADMRQQLPVVLESLYVYAFPTIPNAFKMHLQLSAILASSLLRDSKVQYFTRVWQDFTWNGYFYTFIVSVCITVIFLYRYDLWVINGNDIHNCNADYSLYKTFISPIQPHKAYNEVKHTSSVSLTLTEKSKTYRLILLHTYTCHIELPVH